MTEIDEKCPKCGAPLGPVTETKTGRKLQRCSTGSWNPDTRKSEGCEYVKWLQVEPEELDEKCPKCGSNLILQVTRFGKKMKKCSKGGWDKETRKPTGCDYVEWLTGAKEPVSGSCPTCGSGLVMQTTASGKRMIKCETAGWDSANRVATGCTYIQWLKPGESPNTGEENLPPEPNQ